MSAIEFVKECGIDVAKRTLNNAIGFGCAEIELFDGKYVFRTDDLKQIADAWELVFEHGSIDQAKKYADSPYTAPEIKIVLGKAINLVEQCQ